MSTLAAWAAIIGYLATFGGVMAYLRKVYKQIRKETKSFSDGVQCLLRSQIREIYYKHSDEAEPTIREYERQDLDDLYEGYKSLDGNHFVDDLYQKMRSWRVVT